MLKTRWLLGLPLLLAASFAPARAATIRDNAGMFEPGTVAQATRELERIEAKYELPVTVETVPSLDGQNVEQVLRDHARAARAQGLYVLVSKGDHKIAVDASGPFERAFPEPRTQRIWQPMSAEFKKGDFNAGLLAGVRAIGSEAAEASAEYGSLRQKGAPRRQAIPPAVPGGVARPHNGGTFGMGTLLGIGLVIIAVLIGIRLLGALFGGGAGAGGYGPGRMGGPGYGGPGYGGGGGGGFLSGLFGGLGGAIAGNWLYDQFSGRHHGGYVENTSYGDADPGTTAAPDNNDWSGSSGSWDDAGGGGGDTGGGGDWGGGGGGDWGGGGGDWGGGGGGDGGGW